MSAGANLHVLPDDRRRYGVFEELNRIQEKFGYVPHDQMRTVAERRGLELRDVHSVASFYPHFHMHEPKRADVAFCDDMTCHLRGSAEVRARVEEKFKQADAKDISFRRVSCLGRCDAAPAFAVNSQIIDSITADSAVETIHKALGGLPIGSGKPVTQPAPLAGDPYVGGERYQVVRKLVQTRDFAGTIATLKDAGLRGMGGAGFPAHIKWELVRTTPASEKFMVCNADESEPGTIKDRFIMMHMPHVLVEGMIVGGLTVSAKRGWIYIRHEYEHATEALQEQIKYCYENGLLGRNILGTGLDFDLEMFISPGGYICGEVSALLEAIEGKRAEPRDKPPQTGTHGLWQKPTLAHNVETLTQAVAILARGPEWYKAQGRNGALGLKFVGITGHVNQPGAYEVPMGTTYTEMIDRFGGGILGGRKLYGFAPSGPSSGYLPASMADTPMDWGPLSKAGSMVGSSAIVICAEGTCMLDMALNAIRFFRVESCGKCVPCRLGTEKMYRLIEDWTQGRFVEGQMELLDELSEMMKTASICGLGQIAPVPVLSVIKHFREQVDAHILHKRCPAGTCLPN